MPQIAVPSLVPVVNDWIDGVAVRYAYLAEADLEEHHYAEIRPGQARGDG